MNLYATSLRIGILVFLLCTWKTSFSQADSTQDQRRFYLANIRLGMSSLRDFGLGFSPFVRNHPMLTFSVGYRRPSSFVVSTDCLFGVRQTIGGKSKGPYLLMGFDTKNGKKVRKENYAAMIGYRHLNAGKVTYTESGCAGGGSSQSKYQIFYAKSKEVIGKFYMDYSLGKGNVDFYLGIGGTIRFDKKSYLESGTLQAHWPDDDVEKITYLYPTFDTGFRFNLFGVR